MRDTFYGWLALAMFFPMCFGHLVARAATGEVDLIGVGLSAGFGIAAGASVASHYREAIARAKANDGEGS